MRLMAHQEENDNQDNRQKHGSAGDIEQNVGFRLRFGHIRLRGRLAKRRRDRCRHHAGELSRAGRPKAGCLDRRTKRRRFRSGEDPGCRARVAGARWWRRSRRRFAGSAEHLRELARLSGGAGARLRRCHRRRRCHPLIAGRRWIHRRLKEASKLAGTFRVRPFWFLARSNARSHWRARRLDGREHPREFAGFLASFWLGLETRWRS